MGLRPSRRAVLKGGAALAGATAIPGGLARALAAPAIPGKLSDIDHVVILIQENRSFDHYFGTYPAVRGFSDLGARPGAFSQRFKKNAALAPVGSVLPYHLDTSMSGKGECTPDPTHGWGPQHQAWNHGAMDAWGGAHDGDADWSFMGYYTRADLPYYYAVADAFTICDGYHCSVMGSTSSNRVYSVSAWLDPDGVAGGPVKSTISWPNQDKNGLPNRGTLSWTTYPERLTAQGISWLAYSSPDADSEENPLVDFKQFYPGAAGYQPGYTEAVFGHTFADFLVDAALGNLPQVSFVLTSIVQDEHPSGAPHDGELALSLVIDALTANTSAWAKTVLFYTYDENGGFFDHVAPPTPPPGTKDEFTKGDPLPIGLGFRVPTLIVSPFSRGGFVARDTFDHTSPLRFIERRFGVEIPNLTAWRRETVGDMTSALNFAGVDPSVPTLPVVLPDTFALHPECVTEEASMAASPAPATQVMPVQEEGRRPSPSGLGGTGGASTSPAPVEPPGPLPSTSSASHLCSPRERGEDVLAIAGAAALGASAWWARRRTVAEEDPS